jgi:AMP nucleosidase
MPAWHLITADGQGITLINIGVGPSNAKTICDHLAVLRPDVWLMIGHCGGLRESQLIGDYVLAHAYLRDDHVLDAVLPPDIPIPALPKSSARCTTPPKRSAGCRAKRLNNACVPARLSPPMTATGSCATLPLRCVST